jgi:hypothetical protein
MKKIVLFYLVFLGSQLFAQKLSDEMLEAEIVCNNTATFLPFKFFEKYLISCGNIVKYEFYDNNEIIVVAQKEDHLTKGQTISRFQFFFIKNDKGSGHLLNNVMVNNKIVPIFEIYAILSSLGSEIKAAKEQVREKVIDAKLKKKEGNYKGFFVEDGDESNDKIEMEINLIYLGSVFRYVKGKLKYDGDDFEFESRFDNSDTKLEIKIEQFDRGDLKPKNVYKFTG